MKINPLITGITLTSLLGAATLDARSSHKRAYLDGPAPRAMDKAIPEHINHDHSGTAASLAGTGLSSVGGSEACETVTTFVPDVNDCFVQVRVPTRYNEFEERVLVKEASTRLEPIPAQYEWREERVLVKEASTRLEVVPAEYETVEERVLTIPEGFEYQVEAASFRTEEDKIKLSPAHAVWGTADMNVEGDLYTDGAGNIFCYVEEDAEFQLVNRQVLDRDARAVKSAIPAEYQTVTKQVLVQDAYTQEVEVPAVFDTIRVRELIEPASYREIEIPAEYKTITRREVVRPAHIAFEEVLCEDKLDGALVSELELTLKESGYDVGEVDGILDSDTRDAVRAFQRDNELSEGGLTISTLEEMGLVEIDS
jgi:hypothetical protein